MALVTTMARTALSSPSSVKTASSRCSRSGAIALTGGRLSTTVATPPSRVTVTSWSSAMHAPHSEGEQVDAAGHVQHLPGDVLGLRRAEEDDGVGHVVRFAGSAHRGAQHHAVVHLGVAHLERLGGDD